MNTDRWTAPLIRALALGACLLLAAGCGIKLYGDISYSEGRGYRVEVSETSESGSTYHQYVFDNYDDAATFADWVGRFTFESFFQLEEYYGERGPNIPLPGVEPSEGDERWRVVTGPVPPPDELEEEEAEEIADPDPDFPSDETTGEDEEETGPYLPPDGYLEYRFDLFTPVPFSTTNSAN